MGWLESPMALVWLAYFSIAEFLSLMPSEVSSCVLISEEASAENYSGNYACASMHEAIFRFVRFIWENASHDNVVAFGTITVSVFTYTLWRSTNKLWDAAKEQARITENGFAQSGTDPGRRQAADRKHLAQKSRARTGFYREGLRAFCFAPRREDTNRAAL
jgi:hypothetical protein